MTGMQHIKDDQGDTIAIMIKSDYDTSNSHFLTEPEAAMNIGYLNYPKGHVVKPHYHPKHERTTVGSPEVVIVKEGKIKLFLYDAALEPVGSYIMEKGDIFLLMAGGHAEEILEDAKVFVAKQGPYLGAKEKVFFDGPMQ